MLPGMWVMEPKTAISLSILSGSGSIAAGSLAIEIFGVSLSVLLAGFTGAVVALAFLPPMTRWRLFGAVAIGTLVAAYGTLLGAHIFGWPEKLHVGIAFFSGALGHSILSFFYSSDARAIVMGWLRKPGANP